MGKKITRLRVGKGMSQRALATELGVSPSTLNGWESGRNKPEDSLMLKVANKLGTSISFLYGEVDYPGPPNRFTGVGPTSEAEARTQQAARMLREAAELLEGGPGAINLGGDGGQPGGQPT